MADQQLVATTDQLVFEQEEEVEGTQNGIEEQHRRVYADKSDLSIFEMHHRYTRGKLKLQPDFQRYYVWEGKLASRLIESVLLEIPIPVIYLAQENDNTYSVIDGQQRLTALFNYMENKFGLSSLSVMKELSKTVFGKQAFRRFKIGGEGNVNGSWEEYRVNKALYDIVMFGFTRYTSAQIVPSADAIREELIWLMTHDSDFIESITVTTDSKPHTETRFKKWLNSLETLVGTPSPEPRYFSLAFKESLWKGNPTCEICGNRIHILDDAEVDHVQHYWRGGKTVEQNARLTHRYCNRARGGRD